jgi:O-antigen ligase
LRDLALVAIGIAALLAVQPAYTARLASLAELPGAEAGADNSIRSRATEVLTAVLVFADHPVIGVGRGLFPLYYRRYADEVAIEVQNADRESHNLYAGIAAETGIFGLVAFMGILIVTLRDLDRARRRWAIADPVRANLATGFLLTVVSYMTTGLFLHLAYERYFWLLLALAGATGSILLRADVATAGADESADKSSPAAGTDRPALITADAGPRS